MTPTEPPENATGLDGKESGTEALTPGGALESQPEAKQEATADLSEPSLSTPAPPVKAKTKGVADIVFMVDSSGSMAPCIDALRTNIEAFIDSLSKGEANNAPPIRDWRGKVMGYRDVEAAQPRHRSSQRLMGTRIADIIAQARSSS